MTRFRILVATALVGAAALGGSGAASGAPTYWCYGEAATIVGTPGDDELIGREDTADVIVGLGGDDIIRGAEDVTGVTAPGDRLCGGSGADYIRGGVGNDRIQGGADDDNLDGSYGVDFLTQGGAGNDLVADCDSEYTGGVHRIFGGPGDDHLCVDTGSAEMYGEGGNDVLVDFDCASDSRLAGGGGDDRLKSFFYNEQGASCSDAGTLDADHVLGGDGEDFARVNPGDVVTDTETVVRQ